MKMDCQIGSDYMKIEKINDNQIRCTLNKADLASRHLKISELAYGSEKAKALFRDMMQQASSELGFDAEDIPLMIEAIPVSAECIVLIVTKVDDPEELDTRFSKFSSEDDEDESYYSLDDDFDDFSSIEEIPDDSAQAPTAADELTARDFLDKPVDSLAVPSAQTANDVINLFSKVKDYLNKNADAALPGSFTPLKDAVSGNIPPASDSSETQAESGVSAPVIRIYSFDDFNSFESAAEVVYYVYSDKNSLFKDKKSGKYFLVLEKTVCSSTNFNKACNILSEYGTKENMTVNSIHYFKEHFDSIIPNHAIQTVKKI